MPTVYAAPIRRQCWRGESTAGSVKTRIYIRGKELSRAAEAPPDSTHQHALPLDIPRRERDDYLSATSFVDCRQLVPGYLEPFRFMIGWFHSHFRRRKQRWEGVKGAVSAPVGGGGQLRIVRHEWVRQAAVANVW